MHVCCNFTQSLHLLPPPPTYLPDIHTRGTEGDVYVIAYANLISKTGLHVDSGVSSLLQCVAFIHLFEYLQGNIPVFITTSELENISQ